jgi:uncharacterized integral membrane protein
MNRNNKLLALYGVLAVAGLLLSVLFGAASAAPAASGAAAVAKSERASALIAPPGQAVTGSVEVNPNQQGQTGGASTTTQTTNIRINIPWWVWIVGLLLLVVIVALIAGNRGGTTVIKD